MTYIIKCDCLISLKSNVTMSYMNTYIKFVNKRNQLKASGYKKVADIENILFDYGLLVYHQGSEESIKLLESKLSSMLCV